MKATEHIASKPQVYRVAVKQPSAPKAAPKSEAPVTDAGKIEKELDTLEAQSLTSEQHAAVANIRDILKLPDDTTPIEPPPEEEASAAKPEPEPEIKRKA